MNYALNNIIPLWIICVRAAWHLLLCSDTVMFSTCESAERCQRCYRWIGSISICTIYWVIEELLETDKWETALKKITLYLYTLIFQTKLLSTSLNCDCLLLFNYLTKQHVLIVYNPNFSVFDYKGDSLTVDNIENSNWTVFCLVF